MSRHKCLPNPETDTTRFRFTFPAPWYEAPSEGILPKPMPRVGYLACTPTANSQNVNQCTFGQPCQVTPEQMTTHIAQEAREGRVVAPFPVHDQLSFPSDWEEGWLDVPTTWSGW